MNQFTTKILHSCVYLFQGLTFRIGLSLSFLITPLTTGASPSTETEIHITLLGQPCLLQGPFDELTLRAVHGIGPAQIYPNLSVEDLKTSKDQAQRALETIKTAKHIPSLLDLYKDRLERRLTAQIAFMDGLLHSGEQIQTQSFIKKLDHFLKSADLQQLEVLLRKVKTHLKHTEQYRESLDQAFDYYNEKIETDPESEFHKAIKKLHIQYTCSFEESDDLNEE
jgi:hypothetical protein